MFRTTRGQNFSAAINTGILASDLFMMSANITFVVKDMCSTVFICRAGLQCLKNSEITLTPENTCVKQR